MYVFASRVRENKNIAWTKKFPTKTFFNAVLSEKDFLQGTLSFTVRGAFSFSCS
jgi:hypothetical protein